MRSLLLAVLAAYIVAAIHAILAFSNKRKTLQSVALWSLAAGFVLHTAALFADWIIDGHYPLFYLRETLSFFGWALAAAYILALYRYKTQALGAFVLPLVTGLVFVTALIRPESNSAISQSGVSATWLFPIHTTLLIFAYAAFFLVFLASSMYLFQERALKHKTFGAGFHRLPSLSTVNDIASTAALIGVTCLTIGIATGMIWSSYRDGRLWHNDPKEIFAVLTWLLYFGLTVYRSTAKWRGRRAAWVGIAGFALVLFTFFGARLMGGYHVFG